MAEHRITTRIPEIDIENADITVEVHGDSRLLGELVIRRGAIVWRPTHHRHVFRLRWETFDELMRERGRRRRR